MPNTQLPNINLRVFRREKTDMALIYNCTELVPLCGGTLVKPEVYIDGKKLDVIVQKARAKDATSTDICIFIDYQANDLNSTDKYTVELRFSINAVDFVQYYIDVEGAGLIPSIKDNKNSFSQPFIYSPQKKRWVKPTAVEDESGNNKLLVIDEEALAILKEIRDILKSKQNS